MFIAPSSMPYFWNFLGFGSNTSTTTASSGLFGSSFGSSTSNTTGGGLFGGSTSMAMLYMLCKTILFMNLLGKAVDHQKMFLKLAKLVLL